MGAPLNRGRTRQTRARRPGGDRIFGAYMQLDLVNDVPFTIVLDV